MIDELINKQVEEFRKKFQKHKLFAKGAYGFELSEVEAHLVSSMKKVGEEIKKLAKKRNYCGWDHDLGGVEKEMCEGCNAVNNFIVTLTDKGE